METTAPILKVTSDELGVVEISDLPDVVGGLWGCLLNWNDPPGTSTLTVEGFIASEDQPFRMTIGGLGETYEDDAEVMLLEFDDGTALTANLATAPRDAWVRALTHGDVQRNIEEVVSLAIAADLPSSLTPGDRRIAQAILDLLGELATSPDPPRGVIHEAATWLWRKVDLFLDEAAKTGGKAVGAVAVGAIGYAMQRQAPELAAKLRELLAATR
jgi:hypothetical protein